MFYSWYVYVPACVALYYCPNTACWVLYCVGVCVCATLQIKYKLSRAKNMRYFLECQNMKWPLMCTIVFEKRLYLYATRVFREFSYLMPVLKLRCGLASLVEVSWIPVYPRLSMGPVWISVIAPADGAAGSTSNGGTVFFSSCCCWVGLLAVASPKCSCLGLRLRVLSIYHTPIDKCVIDYYIIYSFYALYRSSIHKACAWG